VNDDVDRGPEDAGTHVHLLLVDDDAAQREMYRVRLTKQGYRVDVARSADEAVAAVRRERPDVVVLDIAMPERDGLSALQEFLDMDPTLPVIIHTAYASYADNFLSWAADAYVVKASDLSELVEKIESVVEGGQAGRA
jgi:two-component system, response regulator, stage 0 sporulation protein F